MTLDDRLFANLDVALAQIERPTVADALLLAHDILQSFVNDNELTADEQDEAFVKANILEQWAKGC